MARSSFSGATCANSTSAATRSSGSKSCFMSPRSPACPGRSRTLGRLTRRTSMPRCAWCKRVWRPESGGSSIRAPAQSTVTRPSCRRRKRSSRCRDRHTPPRSSLASNMCWHSPGQEPWKAWRCATSMSSDRVRVRDPPMRQSSPISSRLHWTSVPRCYTATVSRRGTSPTSTTSSTRTSSLH